MTSRKSYIDEHGEALELDAEFFKSARRGRPSLPEEAKKQRVNLTLDRSVVIAMRGTKNMSKLVNDLLRKEFGV